jgi:hypothetical protein
MHELFVWSVIAGWVSLIFLAFRLFFEESKESIFLNEIMSDKYLTYRIRDALSKYKKELMEGKEIQVDKYIIKQVR